MIVYRACRDRGALGDVRSVWGEPLGAARLAAIRDACAEPRPLQVIARRAGVDELSTLDALDELAAAGLVETVEVADRLARRLPFAALWTRHRAALG